MSEEYREVVIQRNIALVRNAALEAELASREALIERLVEAGDGVIADYVEMTKWTGSIDVVQGWRILVAEYRATISKSESVGKESVE